MKYIVLAKTGKVHLVRITPDAETGSYGRTQCGKFIRPYEPVSNECPDGEPCAVCKHIWPMYYSRASVDLGVGSGSCTVAALAAVSGKELTILATFEPDVK